MTTPPRLPTPYGRGELDPQAEQYLQTLALLNEPPLQEKTPEQARADRMALGHTNAGVMDRAYECLDDMAQILQAVFRPQKMFND